jgi:hypothetical protein
VIARARSGGRGRESTPGGALDQHRHEGIDPGSIESADLLLDDLVDERGSNQVIEAIMEPIAHAAQHRSPGGLDPSQIAWRCVSVPHASRISRP